MRGQRFLSPIGLVAAGFIATGAYAQSVISVHSGVIHYTEGDVRLDGKAAEIKFGQFPSMKENAVLRTGRGRAEVLLSPGVFVRIGENSAIRMVSNRLTDTRVEFLEGAVLVECAESLEENQVTFHYQNSSVALRKDGVYRFDSEPVQLRVYRGEADVVAGGQSVTVKGSRRTSLDGDLEAVKFDNSVGDSLFRWSRRRAEYLAMANVSAANSVRNGGMSWRSSGWAWNPYLGMMTFIPANGMYNSYFGYSFWSPRAVARIYEPPRMVITPDFGGGGPRFNPNTGYNTAPRTAGSSGGYSGGAPATAVAAPSNPRTSDSSSPRGGGGGRGR